MKAMIKQLSIDELIKTSTQMLPKRKFETDSLAPTYLTLCKRAKTLFDRWMLTESDEVFREWQYVAKQAASLKVTISNRIEA